MPRDHVEHEEEAERQAYPEDLVDPAGQEAFVVGLVVVVVVVEKKACSCAGSCYGSSGGSACNVVEEQHIAKDRHA